MISCAAKGCHDPPCTLAATSYPTGREWRFCLTHFWKGVHVLLNHGAERVIVRYPPGAQLTPTGSAPYLGNPEPTP